MSPRRRLWSCTIVIVGAVALAPSGAASAAHPGSLDRGFGDGGSVAINPPHISFTPLHVATLADGRIVVAGITRGTDLYSDGDVVVLRYLRDGTLDPTFGTDGVLQPDLGVPFQFAALTIVPGGAMVLAGSAKHGPESVDAAVARLGPDGIVDRAFGSNGLAVVEFPAWPGFHGWFTDVAVQANGALVAVGQGDFDGSHSSPSRAMLARLTPTGAIDPTFMDGGRMLTRGHSIAGIAVTAERTFVIGTMFLSDDAAVFGLSFGDAVVPADAGRTIAGAHGWAELSASGVGVRPDGTVVVSAAGMRGTQDDAGPYRSWLMTFNGELRRRGSATLNPGMWTVIGIDARGRVVTAGGSAAHPVLSRLRGPDLTLDRSFGRGGHSAVELLGSQSITSTAVQPDGATLVLTERPDFVRDRTALGFLTRYRGGDDVAAPRISIQRARPGCVRGRRVLRIHVRDGSVLDRVTVRGAAHADRRGRRLTIHVPARTILPARRRVTVTATDAAGNTRRARHTVSRCVT